METAIVVALISAAVSLASLAMNIKKDGWSAQLNAKLQRAREREQRQIEAERVVVKYREPLAQAAYDLQSRLYNIFEKNLLGAYLHHKSERVREYVVENTVFLIAQYFAWTELIRRDIRFMDLGHVEKTRQVARLQDRITSLWQSDSDFFPPFRVWAGEQRAIGESLIERSVDQGTCVGYAQFLDLPPSRVTRILDDLRSDVQRFGGVASGERARLREVQNALIDLLALLDPDFVRFPAESRSKIF